MPTMTDKYTTVREATKQYNRPAYSFYRAVRQGKIKVACYTTSPSCGKYLLDKESVARWNKKEPYKARRRMPKMIAEWSTPGKPAQEAHVTALELTDIVVGTAPLSVFMNALRRGEIEKIVIRNTK